MERTTPKVDTRNMAVRITSALVFGLFFFSLLWFGDRPWAPWTIFPSLARTAGELGCTMSMPKTICEGSNPK